MARKKKEETVGQVETVQAELAPALATETKGEVKKTVKRARTTKKPTPKTAKENEKQAENENKETPVEAKEKGGEGRTEAKAEVKPQKPKRGRKPAVKKADEPTADSKPVEKAQEPAPAVVTETKEEVKKTVTRAEKNETIRSLVKEMLSKRLF